MRFRFAKGIPRAVAAAVLVGLVGLSVRPSAAEEKVLKMIPGGDLKILDPIQNASYITRNHGYMIYDTLFALDSKNKIKPQMVEKFTVSKDKKTYTFTLRPGLKWHDGAPVTAADCAASVKRWGAKDVSGRLLMAATDSVAVVNDKTFTLTLKEPYGLVLESLGKPSSNVPFMMPERVAKTDPNQQITDYTGSGPFIFKKDEWVPGSKVVYVKNPSYVPRKEPADGLAGGKVVKVDRVEWTYIPDQNTALAAFTNGEADIFELPQADFLGTLEKTKGVALAKDALGNQGWLRPNHLHPPFNNPKARQALLYVVNQDEYLAAAGFPEKYRLKACGAYFMCGGPNATEAGAEPVKRGQNLVKAKQLLKEAGYKGEKVIVLTPSEPPLQAAAAQVTVQNLKKIGLNVEAQAMDWSTLLARRAKKDPPDKGGWSIFHTYSVGFDVASPVTNAYLQGACEEGPAGWSCDPEMEKLRMAWAKESDPAKRKKLTDTIQKRAYEMVPYVNFGQFFQPMAYRTNLKGLINIGVPVLWNVEK
ncbi:MAG: ABC transporter substrate-binding protein [Deltaproteobacteria bacterium]|nr:ABC transporter substrate-binding protein [Deltaproteobacteria bacterium]